MQGVFSFQSTIILICLSILFVFGLIGQYSAAGGSFHPFVFHQFIVFGISFPVMLALRFFDSEIYIKYAHIFYIFCICLLIFVTLTGRTVMGAARWIKFQNITLQPSEITKISVILMLAKYFDSQKAHMMSGPKHLIVAILITALPAVFILKQPNLGTTIVISSIALGMTFATPIKIRYIVGIVACVVFTLPVAWSFLHEYQKRRVISFLNPEKDPLGIGYNTLQSKIAIGSGSLYGNGFLNGKQTQLSFLPEKQTDFIFTVISEEWGFIGALSLMMTYSVLVLTSIDIAMKSFHYYDKLIAIGIACFFLIHFIMNIGMVTGLLPVVGVPLPILSYGGSITLTSLISIGMLLSITKKNLNCERKLYAI